MAEHPKDRLEMMLAETPSPEIDLKIKAVDGFLILGVGLSYGAVLVGLIYSLLGFSFFVGALHGVLLGSIIGILAYLTVSTNNRYVLPRFKNVFLWWLVAGVQSFFVGFAGTFLAHRTLILLGAEVPPFLKSLTILTAVALCVGVLTYLTGLLIYQFVRMRNRKEMVQRSALEADFMLTLKLLDLHFLSNSLHTLMELVDIDRELSQNYVKHFVQFIRRVLSSPRYVPLKEELALINSYVFIEKVRKGIDIDLTVNVEDKLKETSIPSLILQPLVENAITHGLILNASKPFVISLSAKRGNGCLRLCVANNGRPITEFKPGVGLSLLQKKLEALGGRLILADKDPPVFLIELPLKQP